MIPLTCDHCDKNLRLRDELAGKRIKCPGCGKALNVPLPGEDEEEEAPPPAKPAHFTAAKPARARDDDDDIGDETIPIKRSARKPNPVFLILGLALGLGGLVAMSACIVFAKQANDKVEDELGEKRHIVNRLQEEFDNIANAKWAPEEQKKKRLEEIEAAKREIENFPRSEVREWTMYAIISGVVFVVGFGIRGYYHFAMKKWHANAPGIGKKRKGRDDDEDDEDLE
jgi:hypothetical protein